MRFLLPPLLVSLVVCLCRAPVGQHSCCSEAEGVALPALPTDATAKERWLRRIHDERDADEANIYFSDRYVETWRQRLRALPADANLTQRFGARWTLAQACVRIGALDEAVDLLEQCVTLAEANPKEAATWLPEVLFRLASTHFRVAEKNNCISRHNAESCILPLSPRAVHADKAGAEAACAVLERLLATPVSDLRLEATWLLNIAHMARGSWPEGVPEAHRIEAVRFAAERPAPRFVDRGAELGLARHSRAGSVVVDDFTGDGRLDVLTCSFDTGKPLRLCVNGGDGSFVDTTSAAGLERQLGGINMVQADVDGDGRLDVLVLRGGGLLVGAALPCSLLRQDRSGHFVDVTAAAGIEVAGPTRTAAFADVDLDGDVDLFIGYETEASPAGVRFPHRLFVNDGSGAFTEATERSGITSPARCVGAVFGDVDGDRDPDLFLSNFLAENQLWLNRGDGTFTEVASARGVSHPEASGPAGFFDHDDDGDLDLLVGYSHHYRQVRTVAAYYIEGRLEDDAMRLFENDGHGAFRDVSDARGLRRPYMASGLAFGDVDDDGRVDVYVTTGAHDMAALFPNVLLLNGDRFADATFAAGVGHLQKGNGVAMGDLDGDGDLDIICQVGGAYQDDAFGDVVFMNSARPSRNQRDAKEAARRLGREW